MSDRSYSRKCKSCGRRIQLRKMPAGQWVAFEGHDDVHDCKAAPAPKNLKGPTERPSSPAPPMPRAAPVQAPRYDEDDLLELTLAELDFPEGLIQKLARLGVATAAGLRALSKAELAELGPDQRLVEETIANLFGRSLPAAAARSKPEPLPATPAASPRPPTHVGNSQSNASPAAKPPVPSEQVREPQSPSAASAPSDARGCLVAIAFFVGLSFIKTGTGGGAPSPTPTPMAVASPVVTASEMPPVQSLDVTEPIASVPPPAALAPSTPKPVSGALSAWASGQRSAPSPPAPEIIESGEPTVPPEQMIRAYYQAIASDDLPAAYQERSNRSRLQTSFEQFEATWRSNRDVEITRCEVLAQNDTQATLDLDILFTEDDRVLDYGATISLVAENGEWRYDGGDFVDRAPKLSTPSESAPRGTAAASGNGWHSLRIGMSKGEVEELLGRPSKMSPISWEYGDAVFGPEVSFYGADVSGWRMPDGERRSDREVDRLAWDKLAIGMSAGELQSLFGQPDSASPIEWSYGPDTPFAPAVSLYSGSVSGWRKPPGRRRSASAAKQLPWGKIREGMSEGEVLKILGHPDSASPIEWEYGDEVYGPAVSFYSGTVTGWR